MVEVPLLLQFEGPFTLGIRYFIYFFLILIPTPQRRYCCHAHFADENNENRAVK